MNSQISHSPYIVFENSRKDSQTFFQATPLFLQYTLNTFTNSWFEAYKNDWLKNNASANYGIIRGLELVWPDETTNRLLITNGDLSFDGRILPFYDNVSIGVAEEFNDNEDGWYVVWAHESAIKSNYFTHETIWSAGDHYVGWSQSDIPNIPNIPSDAIFLGYYVIQDGRIKSLNNIKVYCSEHFVVSGYGTSDTPNFSFNNLKGSGFYLIPLSEEQEKSLKGKNPLGYPEKQEYSNDIPLGLSLESSNAYFLKEVKPH